jgi:hypothetical protein
LEDSQLLTGAALSGNDSPGDRSEARNPSGFAVDDREFGTPLGSYTSDQVFDRERVPFPSSGRDASSM